LAVVIAPLKASAWTGFYFNGAWKTVSNNGAAITIETQNPTISEDSSVSAWAMTCNGTDSYAQVGWVKFSGYASTTEDLLPGSATLPQKVFAPKPKETKPEKYAWEED
jgi:hypothetical protein